MKYYIILQPTIRSMGGEEMYTRNKARAVLDMGYTPIVLHSDSWGDRVFIDDLCQYEKNGFPEFRYEPSVVSSMRKKK